MNIYKNFLENKKAGKKMFAVLIDPGKTSDDYIQEVVKNADESKVDYFFVGGSLINNNYLDTCIKNIKSISDIPIVIFPGNSLQLSYRADAFLYLSLISGRNPELLIGAHVITAPYLKSSNLEVISTGYMLIDGGRATTVTYMSNSMPIPSDKPDISACTAMAGEMLGMKVIFMDAGSGAQNHVPLNMISMVSKSIDVPLIIGGGIRSAKDAAEIAKAGADIIVIGNKFETDPSLIGEISQAIHNV